MEAILFCCCSFFFFDIPSSEVTACHMFGSEPDVNSVLSSLPSLAGEIMKVGGTHMAMGSRSRAPGGESGGKALLKLKAL